MPQSQGHKECSMNREQNARVSEKRYVGLDVHKHYITVGGMNGQQEIVLRPRDVEMERFKTWAESNLRKTDEVVLEATTNTWDVYDTIAPLVQRVVVAHAAEVKQIANARRSEEHTSELQSGLHLVCRL